MTETMKETEPHPLKGIINSNDDPTACAVCSASTRSASGGGPVGIAFGNLCFCCGRAVCKACDLEAGCGAICPICRAAGVVRFPPEKEIAGMVKKNAKRGFAWAQCDLSSLAVLVCRSRSMTLTDGLKRLPSKVIPRHCSEWG